MQGLADQHLPSDCAFEPSHLCCPITLALFRDPVFCAESGTTYERAAIEEFWRNCPHGRRDALTNVELTSDTLYTNWGKRREVAAFLAEHLDYVPHGWRSREDILAAATGSQVARTPARRGVRHWPGLRAVILTTAIGISVSAGLGFSVNGSKEDGWHAGGRCQGSPHGALSLKLPSDDSLQRAHDLMGSNPQWREVRESRSISISVWAPQNLRLDVPRRSLISLLDSACLVSLFILGFTAVWMWAAWRDGAPILFVLFACPFIYAGSSMLMLSVTPLMQRATLAVHDGGLQMEFAYVGLLRWIANVWYGNAPWWDSLECIFFSWEELFNQKFSGIDDNSKSAMLELAVRVRTVTHAVNGVENDLLTVRGAMRTHNWGAGLLSLRELNFLRSIVLEWAHYIV
mmetsp:Transcript_9616/g.22228  ORF Transcript_9616/g.22228 Transcript_9616/m.22228 type:complete len:402 (-) Transcript_9616:2-1207(-)